MSLSAPPNLAILNGVSKLFDITPATPVSLGLNGAFLPVCLNASGLLDPSISGAGVAATAFSGIPAGSLVFLFENSGVLTARLASAAASPNQYPAVGFVIASPSTGDPVTVVIEGNYVYSDTISEFSVSDVGKAVYLDAANPADGHITKTAPSGPGQLQQAVGYVVQVVAGVTNLVTVAFTTGARSFNQLSGICQINQGGTGASTAVNALSNLLAGSYSPNQVLASPNGSSGNIGLRLLVPADIPNLDASIITSGIFPFTRGGTGQDLTLTGGAHFVLRQNSLGGAITVSQLAVADLSDGSTGTGQIVLATGATTTNQTLAGTPSVTGTLTYTTANPTFFAATGTGSVVLATSPSISGASLTGAASVTGTLTFTTANPAFFSAQGNGTKVQLSTGTTTTGDVVTFDANGNTVDGGTLLSALAPLASPTFTGTVTIPTLAISGKISTYNGQATAGEGVAPILIFNATTPTTPVGSTPILAAAPAGLYKVTFYAVVTTAGVGGTDIQLNFVYTDAFGAQTQQAAQITALATGQIMEGVFVIQNQATNNISYTITETGTYGTHPVLTLQLALERVN